MLVTRKFFGSRQENINNSKLESSSYNQYKRPLKWHDYGKMFKYIYQLNNGFHVQSVFIK